MPTYDYQCTAGHTFEKVHKMSESPRVKCPTCGKPAARRISGGSGLVFKGSGFYITDYGKDGKGARKAEAGEGASSASVKSESPAGGSEGTKTSKPAEKSAKESVPKPAAGPKKAAE